MVSNEPTIGRTEATVRKIEAQNELLRLRLEKLEAELASTPPPLTADQIVGQAARAGVHPDPPVETLPKALTRECPVCLKRQPISNFWNGRSRGKRSYRRICRSCFSDGYNSQARAFNALKKRIAEVDAARRECIRCGECRPSILFPSSERTCFHCRVEILQAEKASLLERVPRGKDWAREYNARQRHANPGKAHGRDQRRLDLLLRQSDGTLTTDVVGRMFAEAEGKPCPYCGSYMDRRAKSLDHMIPVSRGGLHSAVNAIICCLKCNTRKGSTDFGDWLAKLKEPFASTACAEYERRYGSPPEQSRLALEFALVGIAVN